MNRLNWCTKQSKGIKIIDLKPELSKSYLKEADSTLESMTILKGKWKLITAYYACYSAFYALLMKCGIRCEIHECSIELMKFFSFDENQINYLKKLKDDRIQTQYYLKEITLKNEQKVNNFVLECKAKLEKLNSYEIEKIREAIKK